MVNGRKSPPLVILGIDAGDPGFIQRWVQEGYLPAIASIMQRGCWGRITGPELISTQGMWLSLFSGVSRSEHGYYFNRQLRPGSYDLQGVSAREARALPFWSHLCGAPRKAAIIDAFETHLIEGVPGLQLANWAVQQQYNTAPLPVSAEPIDLLPEIHRLVGEPIQIDVFKPNSGLREDLEAYRLLLRRIEQKGKLSRHFFIRDQCDLIVIGFSEAHTAAHRFWDYRPGGIRYSNAANKEHRISDAIRDVYHAIDREIGLLLGQLPDEANIFIVSLFGMKDQYPTAGLMEAFCRQLGYHVMSKGTPGALNPLSAVRRIMPPEWRARLSRLLPRRVQELLHADHFRKETDWSKTRAFPIPSLNTSFVRVNLRGREPQGLVEPGLEYESLLEQIEADLRQLVDMRTGQPAVEKVTRTVEAFRCEPPVVLPDLFIEWKASSRFMERVAHPKVELIQTKPYYNRSSYHSFSGLFAAAGSSIKANGSIGEVMLLDFAPTFFTLMGGPLPPKLTGQVIDKMINEEAILCRNPTPRQEPTEVR